MGKRSIVKRLGRAYDAFANSLLKKGRAVEQSIAEKSTAFAGTTITDNMACCQGEAYACEKNEYLPIFFVARNACARRLEIPC